MTRSRRGFRKFFLNRRRERKPAENSVSVGCAPPPWPISKIPMKKLMLFLVLLCLAGAAAAADSPKDVQAAIDRGDYAAAQSMLRQAVSEHPSSAKAHYVLAEVLDDPN